MNHRGGIQMKRIKRKDKGTKKNIQITLLVIGRQRHEELVDKHDALKNLEKIRAMTERGLTISNE